MDIQPKWGCDLGTLPWYTLLNTSAVISETGFKQNGMLHHDYQPFVPKQNFQVYIVELRF